MPLSPLALALRCVRIKNNAKIDRSMMDLIGHRLTTLTHAMREENLSLSKASPGADLGILIGGFFFRECISNNHLTGG